MKKSKFTGQQIAFALQQAEAGRAANQADMWVIMGIAVDPKLRGLLGISLTPAAGLVLALSSKSSRVASGAELSETRENLSRLTGVPPSNIQNEGHVL
jgi:hypothetical protein